MKARSLFAVLFLVGLSYGAAPGAPVVEVNGKKIEKAEIPEATTVKSSGVEGVVVNSTPEDDVPPGSTVVPDESTTVLPDTTTAASSNTTTVGPNTTTVTPSPNSTTTTTAPPTKSTSAAPITVIPSTTLKPNSTTTEFPITTAAPHTGRKFDGASFVGGIITAVAIAGIGLVIFKFYKARAERNYHTL